MNDDEVQQRLAELVALPVGWDSYHADCQPVLFPTAERARQIIRKIGVPPDNVVPICASGPGGSWVQVEWCPDGRYVEIEIDPLGTYNYMAADWQGPGHRRLNRVRDSLTLRRVVDAAREALTARPEVER